MDSPIGQNSVVKVMVQATFRSSFSPNSSTYTKAQVHDVQTDLRVVHKAQCIQGGVALLVVVGLNVHFLKGLWFTKRSTLQL